ncbi:MAG: TrkA C-terminal domain-containing protein, partial [Halodesulfurarchaeum sp.]
LPPTPEGVGFRAVVSMSGEAVQSLSEAPGDLELMYIRVVEGAPAAGKSLQEIQFPEGALVISTAAGNRIPTAETILQPGERYLVAVEPAVLEEVINLLRA